MTKTLVSMIVAVVASQVVHAAPLKSYDCATSVTGAVTVDKVTLRANMDNLVMNFPNYGVDAKFTASFERTAESNVPSELAGHSGGEYFLTANGDSFIKDDSADLTPMYAFVTNGILRTDASGTMIVIYKRTLKGAPSSNAHEWSREYQCTAR